MKGRINPIIYIERDAQAQLAEAERCNKTNAKSSNCPPRGRRRKRTLTSVSSQRWTRFPIPFVIFPLINYIFFFPFNVINAGVNRTAVLVGIQNWQRATCLSFQEFSRLAVGSSGIQFVFGSGHNPLFRIKFLQNPNLQLLFDRWTHQWSRPTSQPWSGMR